MLHASTSTEGRAMRIDEKSWKSMPAHLRALFVKLPNLGTSTEGRAMRIDEKSWKSMPAHLRALFVKLPNLGSEEVVALFPQSKGQLADASTNEQSPKTSGIYGPMKRQGEPSQDSDNEGAVGFKMKPGARRGDVGSAARFFYCAKASREDRNEGLEGRAKKPLNWSSGTQSPGTFQSANTDRSSENHHPTVKPTDLMRYLCRLVTPHGGIILDPFMGSGSTGRAAVLEGFGFIGIDRDAEYCEIARARIAIAQQHPDLFTESASTGP
ncbi:MAG: hypothetical protein B7Z62_08850 [Deltaproteobacteria bacterium 37-65-8]|nr:MAG: hypothetical protein B7Z62_08850 [Deltaproteobacteria bacterium 37-65-8]